MFGRRQEQVETPAAESAGGKGRPTPTRREAEAARKAALKVPSDPKAAKKAMRARERDERVSARAALASGDERALPPRDAGPVRRRIRDLVDGRRSIGEVFIPVAILVLLSGFLKNPTIIAITYYAWLVMLAGVAIDIGWTCFRLRRVLTEEFPDHKRAVGDYFYAVMRSLTLRRLRLPPPKVRPGGRPVEPAKSR